MKMIGNARLGRDAEVRYTGSGQAVAELSLAVDYGREGEDGKRPTQWVNAILWGKQAESMTPYLVKGKVVFVSLRDVHIETYEGKNGTGHKLVASIESIDFVPKQRGGEEKRGEHTEAKRNGYAPKHVPF
jgi:single-strand DNA-binding protein